MKRMMAVAATFAALGFAVPGFGQVGTNQPPPVAGAKPVTVERIKIRGASLDGNLEGNAVERDALVLLPPSYASEPNRRPRSACRRPPKAPSPRARAR